MIFFLIYQYSGEFKFIDRDRYLIRTCHQNKTGPGERKIFRRESCEMVIFSNIFRFLYIYLLFIRNVL